MNKENAARANDGMLFSRSKGGHSGTCCKWMKCENMLSEMSRRRTTNVVPLVGHTSSGQIHRVAKGSEGGVAGGRRKFSGDGWW